MDPNHTHDLKASMSDPLWLEKKIADLNDTFADASLVLERTIFSQLHQDPTMNISPDRLVKLNMKEMLRRVAAAGIDNFVILHNFNKNTFMYQGWLHPPTETFYWLTFFGPGSVGPPTGAHGGALAAVLDQFAGYCAFLRGWCLTGELKLTYKGIVTIGDVHLVKACISNVEGRKVTVSMSIHSLPTLTNDETLLKEAVSTGSTIVPLSPTNVPDSLAQYLLHPAKTLSEVLMINISGYKTTKEKEPHGKSTSDPDLAWKWSLALDKLEGLPSAKSKL